MYSFVAGMSKKLELIVELLESGTKFDVTAINHLNVGVVVLKWA